MAMACELSAEGYGPTILVRRLPWEVPPMHTHPFASKVVLVAGELTVRIAGGDAMKYRAGDLLLMPTESRHEEFAGAGGAVLLVAAKID
jgi:quercetin dioxygenase-like cupin family protein